MLASLIRPASAALSQASRRLSQHWLLGNSMNNNRWLFTSGASESGSGGSSPPTDGERRIGAVLTSAFPGLRSLAVEDVSGGCGQMFQVHVVADEFLGTKTLSQHRMVKAALAEHIKNMHGLSISTGLPPDAAAAAAAAVVGKK